MALAFGCSLLASVSVAAQTVLVDDFEQFLTPRAGRTLTQDRWSVVYKQGATLAEIVVVTTDGTDGGPARLSTRALRIRGSGSSYNLAKGLPFQRIARYPYLSWLWKVVAAPDGADIRNDRKDDSAAQLYVSFDLEGRSWGYPQVLSLGYFYATGEDGREAYLWEGYGSFVKFIPLRSVAVAGVGRWFREERNVAADYAQAVADFLGHPNASVRMRFGRALERANATDVGVAPPELELYSISIWVDSNDTRTAAESLYDDILFSITSAEAGP